MGSIARKGRLPKKAPKIVEQFTESLSFDKRLAQYDIEGSIAHVSMLSKKKIIKATEKDRLIKALEKIKEDLSRGKLIFKIEVGEDIHEFIENTVKNLIGEELGAKLHTARSRNDQVALDMRMYLRVEIREIILILLKLNEVILKLVDENRSVVMPAYTHLQYAQPIYFRDYIRAYFYMFLRDIDRLKDCLKRVNQMPLGAGAVGGVHYRIDREYVAKKLNFEKVIVNTVDAVSDRDFILEFLSVSSIIMVHFTRLSEEIILWVSPQFNFITLDDSFCSGSSILPQKKNPDIPELVRGRSGRIFGDLMGMLTIMKALPLAYNRDMQEDKIHLFSTVDTLKEIINIYAEMLQPENFKINLEAMLSAARNGFAGALLYADELAKDLGFRKAHEVVGRLIYHLHKQNKDLTNLAEENPEIIFKSFVDIFDKDTLIYLIKITKKLKAKKDIQKKAK